MFWLTVLDSTNSLIFNKSLLKADQMTTQEAQNFDHCTSGAIENRNHILCHSRFLRLVPICFQYKMYVLNNFFAGSCPDYRKFWSIECPFIYISFNQRILPRRGGNMLICFLVLRLLIFFYYVHFYISYFCWCSIAHGYRG